MQFPGYNTGNVILSEGDRFPFRILNLIQLQDDAWYYVLQDINGLKHFMLAEYYENYGFKIGDEINCIIDRINCTGRIFLEPEHPLYKKGEIYTFVVLNSSRKDSENIMYVKEIFGNSIEVSVKNNNIIGIKEGYKVSCIVKNVKKGKPVLEIRSDYP